MRQKRVVRHPAPPRSGAAAVLQPRTCLDAVGRAVQLADEAFLTAAIEPQGMSQAKTLAPHAPVGLMCRVYTRHPVSTLGCWRACGRDVSHPPGAPAPEKRVGRVLRGRSSADTRSTQMQGVETSVRKGWVVIRLDRDEFREWAVKVSSGDVITTVDAAIGVVMELLDEIDHLHNRYAHEGGRPQVLTVDVLIEWMQALDVPTMENVYLSRIPNVYTADFAADLEGRHIRQIQALGLLVSDTEYPQVGRGRYMLKWQPPRNDEY